MSGARDVKGWGVRALSFILLILFPIQVEWDEEQQLLDVGVFASDRCAIVAHLRRVLISRAFLRQISSLHKGVIGFVFFARH